MQLDASTTRVPLEECETLLWRAVLARVGCDAMYGLPLGIEELARYETTIKRRVTVQQRLWGEEARRFVRMGNPDFHVVCAGAKLDPDYVCERLWRAFNKFDQIFTIINPPPARHLKLPQKCLGMAKYVPQETMVAMQVVEQQLKMAF
jgi:hypothetical protein